MTKKQLLRHLSLLHRDLALCSNRMWKISQALGIEENTDIKKVIGGIEELIRLANVNESES